MFASLLFLAQLWLLAASSSEEGPSGASPQCNPGEDPASCDASAADVLLQKGRTTKLEGKDDAAWHPSRDGQEWEGTVNWDGYNKIRVLREEMPGFVAEVYYEIPRRHFGAINATHVYVKFGEMMRGKFVRDFHGIQSREFGMVTWVWDKNPLSIVAMNVSVGIGEKIHTFSHDGEWRRDSLRRVRRIQRNRWDWENEVAAATVIPRSLAVSAWNAVGQVGLHLVNASKDMNLFRDTQAVADMGPTDFFHQKMQAASDQLKQKHAALLSSLNGQLPESSSTGLNCFHFSDALGIQKTSNGVHMPLNWLIPATRGQLVLAPIQRFDLMSGNAMIKYNETDDTIQVYLGSNQHSNIYDPYVESGSFRHHPRLFVGPADGQGRAIPAEGRLRIPALNLAQQAALWSLHQAWYNGFYADYNFLWGSPSEACPPLRLDEVHTQIRENRIEAVGQLDLWQATALLRLVVDAMPCSIDYLRSDIPNSHSYGPFESFGYLHAMLEFPSVIIMRGWNVIDEDLFCPPGGCTTTTTTTTTTTRHWFWR